MRVHLVGIRDVPNVWNRDRCPETNVFARSCTIASIRMSMNCSTDTSKESLDKDDKDHI